MHRPPKRELRRPGGSMNTCIHAVWHQRADHSGVRARALLRFLHAAGGGRLVDGYACRRNQENPAFLMRAFTTFKSPLSAHTLTIGGAAGSAEAEAVVAATGAVAWVNLLPAPSVDEFPKAALEARGVATRAVPMAAPHGLTLDLARSLLAAVKGLPPGPLCVGGFGPSLPQRVGATWPGVLGRVPRPPRAR